MSSGRKEYKLKPTFLYLMAKKFNKSSFFFRYKTGIYLILSFLIGFIAPIVYVYLYKNNSLPTYIQGGLISIFIPAGLLTNIILNFPNIQINLFWNWNSNILFYLINGIITAILLVSYMKQKHLKKILFIILIFYILHILTRFYLEFNNILLNSASGGMKIGKGGVLTFTQLFVPLIISITIIYHISTKLNYKSLFIMILRYILLFFEVSITVFIGFIFIKITLDTGATNYDLFFHNIYILTLGFFLFLIIQIFRDFFKKKLKGFD